MKNTLNRLFNLLLNINSSKNDRDKKFGGASYTNGMFKFNYLNGVFYVIANSDSTNSGIAYLKVYHDTKLPHSTIEDIIEVPDFIIQIELHSGMPYIYILNHVDLDIFGSMKPTLNKGFLFIQDEKDLSDWFVAQLEALMLKQNFVIYPFLGQ